MSNRIGKAALALLFAVSTASMAVLPVRAGAAVATRAVATQAIPFAEAEVSSPDNRGFTIAWSAAGATSVAVYAGEDPAHIGRDRLVGRAGGSGRLTVADLPARPRWYFELVPDRGQPLVVADRSLHLATAPNFRDAGGYRTEDGRWVRMGLLYRSDQLDLLGEADLGTLHAIGLHLVCDLRTDGERAHGLDRLPEGATPLVADVAGNDGASTRMLAIIKDRARQQAELGNGRGAQIMMDAGRQFVDSPAAHKAYHDLFTRLADPAMRPGVFHCTAGKDRTGWASAIFLTMMGVPHETVIHDYLLSNFYLEAKNRRMVEAMKDTVDPVLMEPLATVRAEYLEASFDEVAKRYGSFDRYLHEGLELDDATITALRNAFLTGAPTSR